MHSYFPTNLSEEALKSRVAKEFFAEFSYEPFGRVDFCISYQHHTLFERINFLWAEAKSGKGNDIYASFVQLILTIGKAKLQEELLPPSFLGAFDCEKIAFLPYYEIMSVFSQSDFNWNITPSNRGTKEFHQLYTQVKSIIESKKLEFDFASQKGELQEFIRANFTLNYAHLNKIQITKDNFVNIYLKWLNRVRDSISIDFDLVKPAIIDADFYLADLLSYNNTPTEIIENLRILLEEDTYKVRLEKIKISSKIFKNAYTDFGFRDRQESHNAFWSIYERPPKEEFQKYILERRDLLVPEDIRERKGSFFTPTQWVAKAQEYLFDTLKERPYYIWDCAAGTGNLLAGLNLANNPLAKITDKYKIYASTIDESDVDIMREFANIKQEVVKLDLLPKHIFQFDFLNDEFFDIKCKEHSKDEFANEQCPNCHPSKLPQSLQRAIKNEPHKVVIFINPPYAEASSYGVKGKSQVANTTEIFNRYSNEVGAESLSELFAQFFIRIYKEIPDSILASFSTPKMIKSEKFVKFRATFRAKFLKGFMCPADSFDNVKGQFPISFMIWDTSKKNAITSVKISVFDRLNVSLGKKRFAVQKNTKKTFPNWRASFYDLQSKQKAQIIIVGPSMQSNDNTFITNKAKQSYIDKKMVANITAKNLIHFCVYFAIRHCIESTWINDSDRFLHPNKLWENDIEFQNNCLAFTLFYKKNRISVRDGKNHFIPFSEEQVGAKEVFDSHFVYDFINGKLSPQCAQKYEQSQINGEGFTTCNIPDSPLFFSKEAKAVFECGLKLWRYYHEVASDKSSPQSLANPYSPYNANASLYDIKEFFKGRQEKESKDKESKKGKINPQSKDEHFNSLMASLNQTLQNLAKKIETKTYFYGFLEE
ncbi:hypothetical protein [Helicobacter sp. MIT 01-3238]|uniref:hypothetical protein n=1 Tax=Helicobacter sp. MIT 01-3238 TaxID=398627 RepID=UPI000E1E9AE2|nr:hypothetical protein [Helicobacter sp. MIT 01-3238]RDU54314.1 hypothetical protein CQA40_03790 [Helicobacter sp. MIT 01-3238]